MVIPSSVKRQAGLDVPRRERTVQEAEEVAKPARRPWFLQGRFLTRTRVTLWVVFLIILGATIALKKHGGMLGRKTTPRESAAASVDTLHTALEFLARDCGRYPDAREHLLALISDPGLKGWNGPYVNVLKPDPWGHPFGYAPTPSNAVVYSLGEDGVRGTADDLEAACAPVGTP
jgi:general secretion pathway protein G